MAEVKKRKPRPKVARAIQITVWTMNGGPMEDDVIEAFETAIQQVQVDHFNSGLRLLTQTTRG